MTGCQDADHSYVNTLSFEQTKFTYDVEKNQTKVDWSTTLTNSTIYNFDSFSITFRLYNQSELVDTDTYYYNVGVKHGGQYTGSFYFYCKGKVDSIEYVSWKAYYNSFWDTYKIWIIVASVVAAVAAIIYIIVMVVEDLDLDETREAITDNGWIALSLLGPLAGGIVWGIVVSYWVPILIVLGGIVAFIVLILLAHLIKFIVDDFSCDGGGIDFDGFDFGGGSF